MSCRKAICFVLGSICLWTTVRGQASYAEKQVSVSNMAITLSNIGLAGNAFRGSYDVLGYSSCEYPANSGIEHLFQGGLWLGALVNASQVAVSTGAVDDASGYSTGKSGFEFTAAAGSTLSERSSLLNQPSYHPSAISHQDLVSDFTDRNTVVPGTNIPVSNHLVPLGADVHFEAYNYNYSFADYFVILHYTIVNNSVNNWDSVYAGFWYDGVVRNVNITPPGGSAFFNKGGNGYIDSIFMSYEFDATGDPGFTESYIALQLLGAENGQKFMHPLLDTTFKAHFSTWQFMNTADPLFFSPTDDQQRYGKMSSGLNRRSDWETTIRPGLKSPNNRSNLLTAGPFKQVVPGDTIRVTFALLCAKKFEDGFPNTSDNAVQQQNLVKNSRFIQLAYNGEDTNFSGLLDPEEDKDGDGKITRFILPSPPLTPKTRIVPSDHGITLYWTDEAEFSIDPISKKRDFEGYRLYRTRLGFDIGAAQDIQSSLDLIAEFDQKGNVLFNETGFEAIRLDIPLSFEGDTALYKYRYVFTDLPNGWQYGIALTAFDQGDEQNRLPSLESARMTTMQRVFPGSPANEDFTNGQPYVYPNPYYAGADWEGVSPGPEQRKLLFANLPASCKVTIYTLAGEQVDQFIHEPGYNGSDLQWSEAHSDPGKTQYAGGEHAWDLLSAHEQIIARGIYLFSVEDLRTGRIAQGKFIIIK